MYVFTYARACCVCRRVRICECTYVSVRTYVRVYVCRRARACCMFTRVCVRVYVCVSGRKYLWEVKTRKFYHHVRRVDYERRLSEATDIRYDLVSYGKAE